MSMVYLMQNNEDRDVRKRVKAFQMREAKILYEKLKKLEKLGKISI